MILHIISDKSSADAAVPCSANSTQTSSYLKSYKIQAPMTNNLLFQSHCWLYM